MSNDRRSPFWTSAAVFVTEHDGGQGRTILHAVFEMYFDIRVLQSL